MSEFKNWPLPNDQVCKETAQRLSQFLELGVKFVGVLPSPNEGEYCDAALAFIGKGIPIHQFTELPLSGCKQEHCRCILMALKTDSWKPAEGSGWPDMQARNQG